MKNKSIEMADSFIRRANNKLSEAKTHLEHWNYPESISASQECIELSIKSIFLLLKKDYPKKHEFDEEEFEKVLKEFPEKLNYLEIPKLYLYSKFWLQFYIIAKYGLETLGVGSEKLFEKEEAELAYKHADRCLYAARQLLNFFMYEVK